MRETIPVAVAVLLLLVAVPTATAQPSQQSEDYVGFGEFLGECGFGELPWAVCFQVPGGSTHAEISASDLAGPNVYLWIVYWGADGTIVDDEFACNGVDRQLPTGTDQVDVVVQDPALAALPTGQVVCLGATATTGTLSATFS